MVDDAGGRRRGGRHDGDLAVAEPKALTARAEVRKQDITACAAALFAVHGYAQTRMTDIAAEAGVTKGLLYWYFSNKEALVAETLRNVHEQLRAVQRRAIADVEDPLERVYVGTVASVEFVLDNYRLFQIDVPLDQELRDVYRTSTTVHASDTARTLTEGQRRGSIRSDDSAADLAYGNAGIVNQYCAARASGEIAGTISDVAHLAARYIVRGLAADLESARAVVERRSPPPSQPKRTRSPRTKGGGG